jgi:opacity protein-like surface antigen
MKKVILITTFLSLVSASAALAKTEGNYVGIDILRTTAKSKSSSDAAADSDLSQYYSHNKTDSAVGFGINYKYAFNFDKFFIAPGLFYERLGTTAKAGYSTNSSDPYSQSISLNSRFGLRTDIGYDVTDKFSAYVPLGVNSVSYEFKTSDQNGSDSISSKKTGNETGYFYGLGFSYAISENFSLNTEYNRLSKLKIKSVANATVNDGTIVSNTNVQIFKIGASYKF